MEETERKSTENYKQERKGVKAKEQGKETQNEIRDPSRGALTSSSTSMKAKFAKKSINDCFRNLPSDHQRSKTSFLKHPLISFLPHMPTNRVNSTVVEPKTYLASIHQSKFFERTMQIANSQAFHIWRT
ncbi:unnamed protein product [Linum trigynum]|uniref:Uncharacterized protein n=1 Tax=Linum trigynum TaxID=586398 RepID=A0AAV2EJ78_9ROSI